jgi:hypothetical protein
MLKPHQLRELITGRRYKPPKSVSTSEVSEWWKDNKDRLNDHGELTAEAMPASGAK